MVPPRANREPDQDFTFNFAHRCEGGATRARCVLIRYAKSLNQAHPLLRTTHGQTDLGLEYLGHLKGSYTDTAGDAMNKHALSMFHPFSFTLTLYSYPAVPFHDVRCLYSKW